MEKASKQHPWVACACKRPAGSGPSGQRGPGIDRVKDNERSSMIGAESGCRWRIGLPVSAGQPLGASQAQTQRRRGPRLKSGRYRSVEFAGPCSSACLSTEDESGRRTTMRASRARCGNDWIGVSDRRFGRLGLPTTAAEEPESTGRQKNAVFDLNS